MKSNFENQINQYKTKTDNEIINYLIDFWQLDEKSYADDTLKVVATYKYAGKDKNGFDCGYFVDIRSLNGDILYYPFRLGEIKLYTTHNEAYTKENLWQITVKLSNNKEYRKNNPFLLQLANKTIGKPKNIFLERIEKEKLIRNLFNKTGATDNDADIISKALRILIDDTHTDNERFLFELLQNADDQPHDGNPVSVTLKVLSEHLLLLHNGAPFTNEDVRGISSIGGSTKKNDTEKTGYKGIGFKSVFSDTETVYIDSGGFSFAFDKNSPVYNKITDINSIPWQIKPIWEERYRLPKEIKVEDDFFNSKVGIALYVGAGKINTYKSIIPQILYDERFILFLRHTNKISFHSDCLCLEINKKSDNGFIFVSNNKKSTIWKVSDFEIDIPEEIQKSIKEGNNNIIPEKLKNSTKTRISFAVNIYNNEVEGISNSVLFTYLPTKVDDFNFPFIVNADFIVNSSREYIHSNSVWNEFLFNILGEKTVDWVMSLSDMDNYLKALPLKMNQNSSLAEKYNQSYQEALNSKAFILNHKNELARQDEIVIDKTRLSEIISANLFCQLLETDKCLPSKKIDSKILDEDIFENIEKLYFDDIIEAITNNSDFNDWYISASDEHKKELYKWIDDNDTTSRKDDLRSFVATLPLFRFFDTEHSSYRSIISDTDEITPIITTPHILPIRSVLNKLDFQCSDDLFDENHPLFKYIYLSKEEDLYNSIKESDFSDLSADERKTLFFALADFDGVGDAKLKDIALFKNIKGEFKPLGEMVAYRENVPVWLTDYVLCKEDNSTELSDYLIAQEDEFESIIQKNISNINTSWEDLYKTYKEEWTGQFTRNIIDNYKIDNDLLSIIEESDTDTKIYFLNNIKTLELQSTSTYKKDSYEYRVLQLALSVYEEPSIFSTKIHFDGQCIKDFTISDDVICEYIQNEETKKVKMSLAEILPQYKNQSDSIEKIKSLFERKKDLDRFFVDKPKPLHEVSSELNKLLNIPERSFSQWKRNGNVYQYLFATYYRRHIKGWNNSYVPSLDLNTEDKTFIFDIFDFVYNNNISLNSPFTYGISSIFYKDKYFTNDYILDDERLFPLIEEWANDSKKVTYLINNGVKQTNNKSILFRELFIKNQQIDFVDEMNNTEIYTAILFLSKTDLLKRPVNGTNQSEILNKFLTEKKGGLVSEFNLKELENSSLEYKSPKYEEWRKDHYPCIKLVTGGIPKILSVKNISMLNYKEGDYYYDDNKKILYVSNTNINDTLFEVAKGRKTSFDMNDYKFLCMDGNILVSEEEIETLKAENKEKDDLLRLYREKYGDISDTGNDTGSTSDSEPEEPIESEFETTISEQQEYENIRSFLGGDFDIPKDRIKTEHILSKYRILQYVKARYTLHNNFDEKEYITNGKEYQRIRLNGDRYVYPQGAKYGIWYLSSNIWSAIVEEGDIACVCIGDKEDDFRIFETKEQIDSCIDEKPNALIKISSNEYHSVSESVNSIFPSDNYDENTHLMLMLKPTPKAEINSLYNDVYKSNQDNTADF